MSAKIAMYKHAAKAIGALRVSMDDHSSHVWEAELDLIEFAIYAALSNALDDKLTTGMYIHSDSEMLHSILPSVIARIDDAYESIMKVGDK